MFENPETKTLNFTCQHYPPYLPTFKNTLLFLLIFSIGFNGNITSSPISPTQIFLNTYDIDDDEDEIEDYSQYGEFAEMVQQFDEAIEIDEATMFEGEFFVFKWGKKIKKWFKKTVKNMFLKFLDIKPGGDLDTCAYNVAKLKRHIDGIYNTGNIEKILDKFDDNIPQQNLTSEKFKERVRYYFHNKKATPPKGEPNRFDQSINMRTKEELNDVEPNYIFGSLEIACGCLIGVLPFPGCKAIAASLITDGFLRMGGQYFEDKDKENRNSK